MNKEVLFNKLGLIREFHKTVISPLTQRYGYRPKRIDLTKATPLKIVGSFPNNDNHAYYYPPRELLHLYPDLLKGIPHHFQNEEEVSLYLMDEILYQFHHKDVDSNSKKFVQTVTQRARLTTSGEISNDLPDVDFGDETARMLLSEELIKSEYAIRWRFYNGLAGDPSYLLYGTYKRNEFVTLFNRTSGLSLFLAKRKITKAVKLLSEYDDHNPYEPKIPSWWTFIKTKIWGNDGSI